MRRGVRVQRRGQSLGRVEALLEVDGRESWFPAVREIGFWDLRDFEWDHVDHTLIGAFVEHWHPETNSFHFAWGEITITLHDVLFILGLGLDGEECIHLDDVVAWREIVGEYYGLTQNERQSAWAHGGPTVQLLLQKIAPMRQRVRDGAPLEHDMECILGVVLGMIATATLFIDKSGGRLRPEVIRRFMDAAQVSHLSLAAGVLSCLYRGLGEATRELAKDMDGCTKLLEVRHSFCDYLF